MLLERLLSANCFKLPVNLKSVSTQRALCYCPVSCDYNCAPCSLVRLDITIGRSAEPTFDIFLV